MVGTNFAERKLLTVALLIAAMAITATVACGGDDPAAPQANIAPTAAPIPTSTPEPVAQIVADPLVPAARFDRLHKELGDDFEEVVIDSSPGNPHGISRTAHSVVTQDLVDKEGHPTRAALDRVLALFHSRLDAN